MHCGFTRSHGNMLWELLHLASGVCRASRRSVAVQLCRSGCSRCDAAICRAQTHMVTARFIRKNRQNHIGCYHSLSCKSLRISKSIVNRCTVMSQPLDASPVLQDCRLSSASAHKYDDAYLFLFSFTPITHCCWAPAECTE